MMQFGDFWLSFTNLPRDPSSLDASILKGIKQKVYQTLNNFNTISALILKCLDQILLFIDESRIQNFVSGVSFHDTDKRCIFACLPPKLVLPF